MKRMGQWLREYLPNKPLKDSKDSTNNTKLENNSSRSTRKVKNFLDSSAKLIQPSKRPSSNWPTLKNSTIYILKSSRKSTPSKKCSGLKSATKKLQQWKKALKNTVNNASSFPRISKNGRLTRNSRPQLKTSSNSCPSLPSWKKIQSKTVIGKPWIPKQLTKFHSINQKSSLFRILPKPKSSISSKISKKLVNQPKNKRKLKLLWPKLTNSGNPENSISLVGVKEKMPFWLVSAFKKLLKDSKKIKWHCLQSTPNDTSSHSKRESNNWSEDSLTLQKLLISGSKCKSFGPVWSQSSQEVISPSKCHGKPNNSLVSIRLGSSAWKSLSKLKKSFNAVSLICWRIICLICKRSLKNAKNC